MELPIYYIEITDDPDNGFEFVSLVDKPAIKKEYLKFKSEYLKYTADKQIVTGPVVVVDMPIYRKVNDMEFYTVFDKSNTEKLVKKWALQQKYNAVNIDHETPIDSLYLYESYLINRDRGINPPKEFSEVPDGSWFLSYYVQDTQMWDRIKNGEFNGFSIEGLFGLSPKGSENTQLAQAFVEEVNKFCASLKKLTSE